MRHQSSERSAAASDSKKIHLFQGEFFVSRDPEVVVSTILGSCVAACIRDPAARIGGINHFLLPGNVEDPRSPRSDFVGVHLMELLINGLLREGARRERLEAKLFGGGRTMEGLMDVGAQNAQFATRFIEAEGITLLPGSLGGAHGRRIQFWPVTGRVRQSIISPQDASSEPCKPITAVRSNAGELDLF